jgi:chromosome segregation ATPase
MVAMAQHVTPVNIEIAEVRLDSLRALYMSEPTMYRASLDVVSQALAKNAEEIKDAKAILKVEQTHIKDMEKTLKEAGKMAAALKKLYSKEEGELKSMQKMVEKQQKTVNKQNELTQDTRDNYLEILEREQKELGYSLREVAERQRAIADLETSLKNTGSNQQAYVKETEEKAQQIAELEALYKQRLNTLKAEQKSAKSMQ